MSDFNRHVEVEMGSEKGFGVVFAFLSPNTLSVPNKLWFKLGMVLGAFVAPIVMALIYFISVAPTGLVVRLLGKDLLRQKLDKNTKSYWIEHDQPVGSMRDQF